MLKETVGEQGIFFRWERSLWMTKMLELTMMNEGMIMQITVSISENVYEGRKK
jgi:hypothetical protein